MIEFGRGEPLNFDEAIGRLLWLVDVDVASAGGLGIADSLQGVSRSSRS